jgi:hypothetical protein
VRSHAEITTFFSLDKTIDEYEKLMQSLI